MVVGDLQTMALLLRTSEKIFYGQELSITGLNLYLMALTHNKIMSGCFQVLRFK